MENMHIMVGVPRSGKSTIVSKIVESSNENIEVVSRDIIREQVFGEKSYMGNETKVTEAFNKKINKEMLAGTDIIVDNCNVRFKTRKQLYDLAIKYGYNVTIHIVLADIKTLMARAEYHNFPKHVIMNMLKGNDIAMISIYDKVKCPNIVSINHYITEYEEPESLDFNQENPHHNETVLGHVTTSTNKLVELIKQNNIDVHEATAMIQAIKYHDHGKAYAKEYDEKVNHYRYIGHDNIGSFMHLHRILTQSGTITEQSELELFLIHFHMIRYGSIPKVYSEIIEWYEGYENLLNIFGEADKFRVWE